MPKKRSQSFWFLSEIRGVIFYKIKGSFEK